MAHIWSIKIPHFSIRSHIGNADSAFVKMINNSLCKTYIPANVGWRTLCKTWRRGPSPLTLALYNLLLQQARQMVPHQHVGLRLWFKITTFSLKHPKSYLLHTYISISSSKLLICICRKKIKANIIPRDVGVICKVSNLQAMQLKSRCNCLPHNSNQCMNKIGSGLKAVKCP